MASGWASSVARMAKREAQARTFAAWEGLLVDQPPRHGPDLRLVESPSAEPELPPSPPASGSARTRIYTDVGGAVIGLGAAAALINFVL